MLLECSSFDSVSAPHGASPVFQMLLECSSSVLLSAPHSMLLGVFFFGHIVRIPSMSFFCNLLSPFCEPCTKIFPLQLRCQLFDAHKVLLLLFQVLTSFWSSAVFCSALPLPYVSVPHGFLLLPHKGLSPLFFTLFSLGVRSAGLEASPPVTSVNV